MKAAILIEQKKPLKIVNLTLPKTLEYGQVLVRVHYSGICGAQINEIDGVKGPDKFLPHMLGHEGGGVVEKVGPGVTTVKKGDHVVMHWMKGEGIQSAVPTYRWGKKTVNAGWVTTFSEYSVVSENRVTAIPKTYDLKLASLFGCAITTAFGVIHNDGNIKPGESVVVFGTGGVGSAIINAASVAGAYPIIAIDINEYKMKMSKKLGATYTVHSKNDDIKQKLTEYLGKPEADMVVDTTGINFIRELSYEITSPLGRTILVGVPKKGEKISIDSFPLHFDKKITGSHGGDCHPTYDIPRLIRLNQSGKLDLSHMITKGFPLEQINDAIQEVRTGNVIRVVVKIS